MVGMAVGEVLQRDPDTVRVMHADSLAALPSNTPVASRMAIMLGGAAAGAAKKVKAQFLAIGAHNLGVTAGRHRLSRRQRSAGARSSRKIISWEQNVDIAHRKAHLLPPGAEPGLQAMYVMQVPTGGMLPTPEGRIQMYPWRSSFECHVIYAEIDRITGESLAWANMWWGKDCGTMINPDIVHGMTYGGVAHGIGAALYERFRYDEDGQFVSGTFMDYLLPSSHEVPDIEIADHCTPSPLTVFGQKGSGEAGYLGGPAGIASAVNDALHPLGVQIHELPMTAPLLGDLIASAGKV